MKKAALLVVTLLFFSFIGFSQGRYRSGHGKSHKGGHYKNARTNDHYKKRKH